jgi:purine-binding chemotaxis protein CheW
MTARSEPRTRSNADPGEVARATLEERARLLARPVAPDRNEDGFEVLAFTVAGRGYAVELRCVGEVLPRAAISRLPWAPPALVGVANVRGDIVVVVDTARLLGIGELRVDGPVVILDPDGYRFGLLVDAVDGMTWIAAATLAPAAGDDAVARDLVLGVTDSAVVLDASALAKAHQSTNSSLEGT